MKIVYFSFDYYRKTVEKCLLYLTSTRTSNQPQLQKVTKYLQESEMKTLLDCSCKNKSTEHLK